MGMYKKLTPTELKKFMFGQKLDWDAVRLKSFDDEKYGLAYCFFFYSYNYTKVTHKFFPEAKSVLDFGAGAGASTAHLKYLYGDNAEVVYFDINKEYANLASRISDAYGAKFAISTSYEVLKRSIPKFDVVCCFETLEHCYEPIKVLEQILSFNPHAVVLSASFLLKALGHLDKFKVGEVEVDKRQVYREIKKFMFSRGYVRLKVKLWNNRPWIYVKKEDADNV